MQPVKSIPPLSEGELFLAFETLSLDPALFTHRRHLAFAWRYLQHYGFPDGAARFVEHLKRYVEHVGAAGKFHETITWAYLVLMNEEMTLRSAQGECFDAVAERRPDLLDHRNGALSRVYSRSQLDHPDARRVFMLPLGAGEESMQRRSSPEVR
jgi:hypothetical protein